MTDSRVGGRGVLAWLLPSFDETTLFLMAVTCVLLLAFPSGLRDDLSSLVTGPESGNIYFALFLSWAFVGFGFSVFHAFSRSKKGEIAKLSMAVFAMMTNAAAGVALGVGRMNGSIQGGRWLAVVNIVAAVLMVYQVGFFQDRVVPDEDATPRDLLLGLLALSALFFLFEVIRHFPWPLTFSLCVAYSTFVHHNAVVLTRQIGARRLVS
jgi:hypothetical protein